MAWKYQISANNAWKYMVTAFNDWKYVVSEEDFPSRNADLVLAAGYNSITTGVANMLGSTPYRDVLVYSHNGRIRQSGVISQVQVFIGLDQNEIDTITKFDFKVWRKTGSLYDLVGKENVLSKLSPEATNLITLDTTITAQEGDFVGWGMEGGAYNFLYANGSGKIHWMAGEADDNDFAWQSQSQTLKDITTKVYMQAPLMVGIGDSIMSGYTYHNSFIQTTDTTDVSHQIMYQLAQLNNDIVYQNMGIGGEESTPVEARFTSDVVNLKPKYAIILVGVNDLARDKEKSTYITNMTSMLDACETNSIIPVIVKVLPWSNGTNLRMQNRDDWMADLKILVATYGGSIWVDCDDAIGIFRAGGDAGNLWDIRAAYNGDGVHLNEAGYTKVAETIYSKVLN